MANHSLKLWLSSAPMDEQYFIDGAYGIEMDVLLRVDVFLKGGYIHDSQSRMHYPWRMPYQWRGGGGGVH